jgi:hypothetical protein
MSDLAKTLAVNLGLFLAIVFVAHLLALLVVVIWPNAVTF